MRYLKKYNEELHLNPLQIGKKKWNMPGGLSFYTDKNFLKWSFDKKLAKEQVVEFLQENLKKYFPKIHSKMKPTNLPFDLERQGFNQVPGYYHGEVDKDTLVISYQLTKKDILGQYADPFPEDIIHLDFPGFTDNSIILVKNYLILELDFSKTNVKINIFWFQTIQNNYFKYLPFRSTELVKVEKDGEMYGIYLYQPQDILVGDKVFDQDDLNWTKIKEKIIQNYQEKTTKKRNEKEEYKKRRQKREPIFQELQDTLFDLTLALSDILYGDVEIEKSEILNYNTIMTLEAKIPKNNPEILYELGKEIKQLDLNLKSMSFNSGNLSEIVEMEFSLDTGKYGHNGEFHLYFHWTKEWQ